MTWGHPLQRQAQKNDYDANPKLCERGCGKPIPWARYKRGGRFCGRQCSLDNTAVANRTVKHECWFVYILECADGSFYTGITTDVQRRVFRHNETNQGARYTRSRRPVKLVYQETVGTRAEAQRREMAIKKLSHDDKLRMLP